MGIFMQCHKAKRVKMSRILLALSICAVFAQIGGAQVEVANLFSHADTFLSLLTISVNDAIDHYVPPITYLSEEFQAKSEAVLSPARAEIRAMYNHFANKVVALQRRFRDKDISSCMEYYQPQLVELPNQVTNEVETCMGQLVTQGSSFVERSEAEIQASTKVIDRFKLRILECTVLPETFGCLVDTLDELTTHVINVPVAIQEDAQRARNVIQFLSTQFHTCYEDQIDAMENTGNGLFGNLEMCAVKA